MKLLTLLISVFLVFGKIIGQPDFPPCAAYNSAGKDTICVLNSYSNTLYVGIDNEIKINRVNVPFKNLIVECTMGLVIEDDSNYLVIPAKPGTTTINIYQYDSCDTSLYFTKSIRVKRLPSPYITLDRVKLSDYKWLSRNLLKTIKCFEVHLSDDFVEDSEWFKVKSFVFGYPVGQLYASRSCEGATITEEILQTIKKLPSGTEASFIFTIEGSGEVYERLPPVKIKIE